MAVPKTTIWPLDPHTLAKHEILKRYLQCWFPILNTYHGRIIYIDGFCGPGRYSKGESGSPIIALEVAATHRKALGGEIVFWFIDEDEDRVNHLKSELKTISIPSHFKVHPESGDFREKLEALLNRIDQDKEILAPTFGVHRSFWLCQNSVRFGQKIAAEEALRGVNHLHGGSNQSFPGTSRRTNSRAY